MLEHAGFLYGLLKDLYKKFKDINTWNEKIKLVDRDYLDKSGLKKEIKDSGCEFRWSKPDKVETRKLDGYDYMYEIDEQKRIKYILERKDGIVLIGKKV